MSAPTVRLSRVESTLNALTRANRKRTGNALERMAEEAAILRAAFAAERAEAMESRRDGTRAPRQPTVDDVREAYVDGAYLIASASRPSGFGREAIVQAADAYVRRWLAAAPSPAPPPSEAPPEVDDERCSWHEQDCRSIRISEGELERQLEELPEQIRALPLAPDTHTGTRQRWLRENAARLAEGLAPLPWEAAAAPPRSEPDGLEVAALALAVADDQLAGYDSLVNREKGRWLTERTVRDAARRALADPEVAAALERARARAQKEGA